VLPCFGNALSAFQTLHMGPCIDKYAAFPNHMNCRGSPEGSLYEALGTVMTNRDELD